MSHLTISLFGTPQLTIDGVGVKTPAQRLFPLLAYLAITDTNQTRETLANLLWSEEPLPKALASLRTTLWRMKAAGLDEWIKLERNEISLNHQKTIDVDVLEFKAYLNKCATHG